MNEMREAAVMSVNRTRPAGADRGAATTRIADANVAADECAPTRTDRPRSPSARLLRLACRVDLLFGHGGRPRRDDGRLTLLGGAETLELRQRLLLRRVVPERPMRLRELVVRDLVVRLQGDRLVEVRQRRTRVTGRDQVRPSPTSASSKSGYEATACLNDAAALSS